MFGVHKIVVIEGKKNYFIEYKDEFNVCNTQVTMNLFKEFNSFKSQNIKIKHIYDRYIEHSEQYDEL